MNNKNLVSITKEEAGRQAEFASDLEYIFDWFQKKHLELTDKYKDTFGEDPCNFIDKLDSDSIKISIVDPIYRQYLMAQSVRLCDIGRNLHQCMPISMAIKPAFILAEMINYYSGVIDSKHEALVMKTAQARINAYKRHAENHAIKHDALKYYAENIGKFSSMDDAAEQIAGKIVNAKFRTVRQWIAEYHKNIRSASTA